jgi:ABC-type nitrate/sulfonate/bicarbonate transport system permease component
MDWLALRGKLHRRQRLALGVGGVGLLLSLWYLLTSGPDPVFRPAILPHPWRVITAFGDLYRDNDLMRNTCRSVGINIAGYLEALMIALPLGFLIGLLPVFRGAFQRPVESIRFVPLTAVTGLFIVWFGVGTSMKVHFLAFGILIYLLPVIIQRIDDVQDVFLRTVYTLGASPWQTIRTVYWPAVVSKLSDDVRVLTAISWTYIIVAENIDSTQGGLGALIWRVGQRQGRMDKVFALLLLIILIGVVQDRLLKRADQSLFPYKKEPDLLGTPRQPEGLMHILWHQISTTIMWVMISGYVLLALNDWTGLLFPGQALRDLFGDTVWAIHLLVGSIAAWQIRLLMASHRDRYGRLSSTQKA